jgi:hypothetical protein
MLAQRRDRVSTTIMGDRNNDMDFNDPEKLFWQQLLMLQDRQLLMFRQQAYGNYRVRFAVSFSGALLLAVLHHMVVM